MKRITKTLQGICRFPQLSILAFRILLQRSESQFSHLTARTSSFYSQQYRWHLPVTLSVALLFNTVDMRSQLNGPKVQHSVTFRINPHDGGLSSRRIRYSTTLCTLVAFDFYKIIWFPYIFTGAFSYSCPSSTSFSRIHPLKVDCRRIPSGRCGGEKIL